MQLTCVTTSPSYLRLSGEDDYDPNCGFSAKYNSRAAALLRDKISTEAAGGVWDRRASPALNHKPSSIGAGSSALTHGSKVYQSSGGSVSAGRLSLRTMTLILLGR